MKVFRFLTGRVFLTAVLILIQLVWFITFFMTLTQYSTVITLSFTVLSLLIVLYIIVHDNNASFKIPWIILIMAMPLLGGPLYLFFGSNITQNNLCKRIEQQRLNILPHFNYNHSSEILKKIKEEDRRVEGSLSYLQNYSGYPIWENTETTYYPVGELFYEALLEELEKAEKFIFMEYFILEEGRMWQGIYEILKRKAAQGVDVRLVYDDIGSLFVLPRNFKKEMKANGIQCLPFNPFRPILTLSVHNRDHRKITVIDGKAAFTGGLNIADEYINAIDKLGHWKDTGIRLVGEAVDNFTLMFLEIWNTFNRGETDAGAFINQDHSGIQCRGYVLPFSDSPLDGEAVSRSVYIDIISQSKDYVYIFTPYLIVDDELLNALRHASKRGVDVRLITPGIPDKKIVYRMTRSYYGILMKDGVKIYEYEPGFLHAKSYVSDDEVAIVGTINMDFRSLFFHFECGAYLYKTDSVLQVKDDFLTTIPKCRAITPQDIKRGFFWTLFDAVVRVFAPLM